VKAVAPELKQRTCLSRAKQKLKRRNMTYADLAGMLRRTGVKEDEPNLRNKVARGEIYSRVSPAVSLGVRELRLAG
jgi:hypothetical protein